MHDNLGPGLWADTNNRGFDVEHNYLANNQGEGFIYETSYNLKLADNTFVRNALFAGPHCAGSLILPSTSPSPALTSAGSGAIREQSHDHRQHVQGQLGWCRPLGKRRPVLRLSRQHLDRLLHPGQPEADTTSSCTRAKLASQPYYNDCRWKTQNVLVSRNIFTFDPAHIGPECTPANYCGFNGIFSQWGSWSPYHGTSVENHITFDQNNHFASNVYRGPWQFMAQEQGQRWAGQRGEENPYQQDAGSTMNSGTLHDAEGAVAGKISIR